MMLNKLKYAAVAAALAIAPISASALTTSSTTGDVTEWSFSDGLSTFALTTDDVAASGTFTLDIINDLGGSLYYVFNELASASFTISNLVTTPTQLSFDFVAGAPSTYSFTLAAVPVPAAALLMLTALGGLAISRRRSNGAAAA